MFARRMGESPPVGMTALRLNCYASENRTTSVGCAAGRLAGLEVCAAVAQRGPVPGSWWVGDYPPAHPQKENRMGLWEERARLVVVMGDLFV